MMDWERIGQYIRNASQENLKPYLNFLYFNSAKVSSHFLPSFGRYAEIFEIKTNYNFVL